MSNIPVISVVGYSGSGKTALIEKLIPALAKRGIRTAVIKHDAHEFECDREGKDSWRFSKAGAAVSVIANAEHCAIMENRPVALEALVSRISDVDLILTEGFKQGAYPKIAVFRSGSGAPLPELDGSCLAVVSDVPLQLSIPLLDLNNAEALAAFIYKKTHA